MSIRYAIGLTPDPAFTALAYRARQIICGQYGMWAAQTYRVHITLATLFPCREEAVDTILQGLGAIARASRQRHPSFRLTHRGVQTFPGLDTTIFLDFSGQSGSHPLQQLHERVVDLLQSTAGAEPDLRFARQNYWPHLTLMQNAQLKPAVFRDAVEFAQEVVCLMELPDSATAWRTQLVRFETDAAEDGSVIPHWEKTPQWSILDSFPL